MFPAPWSTAFAPSPARLGLRVTGPRLRGLRSADIAAPIPDQDLFGRARDVRVMFHYDSYLYETEVGDTVCYRPQSRALVFYKRSAICWPADRRRRRQSTAVARAWKRGEPLFAGAMHVDGIASWATGTKMIHQAEGTWRDAEDGRLERNAIAQGAVDGVVAIHAQVEPSGVSTVHHWLCVGRP